MLKETYHLIDTTPGELNPHTLLEPFEPLTHDQYPVFNKYPKFIVDYQVSGNMDKDVNPLEPKYFPNTLTEVNSCKSVAYC